MTRPGYEERREFEAWARQDFETGADLTETFEIRHVNGVRLNHASDWRIWQAARASLPAQQPWGREELAKRLAMWRYTNGAPLPALCDYIEADVILSRPLPAQPIRVALSRPLAGEVVLDYAAAAVVVYGGDGHYSHDALTKARAIVDAALKGAR